MSTAIRVSKSDKERLAKRLGARSLAEAFRLALAAARGRSRGLKAI